MDPSLLAGLLMILVALPGLGLGVALMIGKWRPAAMASAREPDRARVATGRFLLLVDGMLVAVGFALVSLPAPQAEPIALWGTIAIALTGTLGAIPLARVTRP